MRSITFISHKHTTTSQADGSRIARAGIRTAVLLLVGLMMASSAAAGSLPSSAAPDLSDAARHWLIEHGLIQPTGMAECKSNSDCDKGEICCKISALESFCADPDECLVVHLPAEVLSKEPACER